MSRRPIRERKPMPGNEVEVETVTAAAIWQLENLDSYLKADTIMEILTSPHRPGLFSPALDGHLCNIAQKAIEAAALLRRLGRLCGEKRDDESLPKAGVTEAEQHIRNASDGFTDEETTEVRWAAWNARQKVLEIRKAQAGLPAYCPKCGGTTRDAELDGSWRRGNAKGSPPARCCQTCYAVTPNIQPTAKVLSLVKPMPELVN